jgi:hypothetical protein
MLILLLCHFQSSPPLLKRTPFNVLIQWHGLQPTASGFVPLSMAEFSL